MAIIPNMILYSYEENCIFLSYFANYNRYHHHLWLSERYLHRHHLCKVLCNSIRKISVIDFFCFCGYLIFRKLSKRKQWKSTTNLHPICIFLGYIDVCSENLLYYQFRSFSNSSYWIHLFLKWSKLWKDIILINLAKQFWTVKKILGF